MMMPEILLPNGTKNAVVWTSTRVLRRCAVPAEAMTPLTSERTAIVVDALTACLLKRAQECTGKANIRS